MIHFYKQHQFFIALNHFVGVGSFQKNHKLAPLSLMREASFGHGRLSVVNATTARWTWHRNNDADSTVRDELWLESLAANGACRQGEPAVDFRDDEL